MSKLQLLEEKLKGINEAVFQNLCDAYLFYTIPDCKSISHPGSQKGKQKTTKGTPDSYYLLPSGQYVFIEHTTKDKTSWSAFLKKVKDDIHKCLDPKHSKIAVDKLDKIIYCCNCSLNAGENEEIYRYAASRKIKFELITLDALCKGILFRCPFLAKEFLGIPIDSGQVLTPAKFVKEYQASALATKLDTTMVSRDNELQQLRGLVSSNSITVLKGAPGVGKTRLALECLDRLRKETGAVVYCISNKVTPIFDDLSTYLAEEKNYILLIDDANRQINNLKQILGKLREKKKGTLRLLITIRDYAFEYIDNYCADFMPTVMKLPRMTDDQIKELLRGDDYKIKNYRFINRIVAIADGNPRLAVMGASLALEKQDIRALADVSHLYDRYFTLSVNPKVFADKTLLKVMGLVSFFGYINISHEPFQQQLESRFRINRHKFLESLEKLERFELLESSADVTVFRLSEQVTGTYFFYFTFFKKPVLDFGILLTSYFDTYFYRFSDTVIPANNTFGYQNVFSRIDPFLTTYWKKIQDDETKAFKFLELFWYYRLEESLAFVYRHIGSLPESAEPFFVYREKDNMGRDQDKYLELVSRVFHHPLPEIKDALELALDYVRKKPACFSECCRLIESAFMFRVEDEHSIFYRQHQLITFLIQKSKTKDELADAIFFRVVAGLMKGSYRVVEGGIKKNSISWYEYPLPPTAKIKAFRSKAWKHLDRKFAGHPREVEKFLETYLGNMPGNKVDRLVLFDLPLIAVLVQKHFTSSSFIHCWLLDELLLMYKRFKINDPLSSGWRKKFTGTTFRLYQVFSNDRHRYRIINEEKIDYKQFEKLKEEEIRKHFRVKSSRAGIKLLEDYAILQQWSIGRNYQFNHSLDTGMSEIAHNNPGLVLRLLSYLITHGNRTDFVPFLMFKTLANDEQTYLGCYEMLKQSVFPKKDIWLLHWFRFLPAAQVRQQHVDHMVAIYRDTDEYVSVYFSYIEQFLQQDALIFHKILQAAWQRNNEAERRISIWWHVLEEYLDLLSSDVPLLKKTYLQQERIVNHFDYDLKGLFALVALDNAFLNEYLELWSGDRMSLREFYGLSNVWKLKNAETLVEDAMNFLTSLDIFSGREDICNAFFKKLDDKEERRAAGVLEKFIDKHYADIDKMETVFDCLRHSLPEHLARLFKKFLLLNPKIEEFKAIQWIDRGDSGNGGTIFGDLRAAKYDRVLKMLEAANLPGYKYTAHRQYLKERRDGEKRQGDEERKQKFMLNEF